MPPRDLHPAEIFYAFGYRDGQLAHLGSVHDRDLDPAGFLDRLWNADQGCRAVGIKILHGQAPDTLQRVLQDPGIQKILLRRRNRIRTFVSLLRARKSGHYAHVSYDGTRVRVDPRELFAFIRGHERFYSELDATLKNQPFYLCWYEELGSSRIRMELLAYLDVDPDPTQLSAVNKRQSSDRLHAVITNFDELERALQEDRLRSELLELDGYRAQFS